MSRVRGGAKRCFSGIEGRQGVRRADQRLPQTLREPSGAGCGLRAPGTPTSAAEAGTVRQATCYRTCPGIVTREYSLRPLW